MAVILVRVDDLMLGSKVTETLRSAGHAIAAPDTPPEQIELIVCDLDAVDPAEVGSEPAPSLGFYPHTEVETRRRAEEAGVDLVVPRSRMARELPELVDRLLDAG